MREYRNPFTIRTAEQIDSVETFLRLFYPNTLDLISKDKFLGRVEIYRSAPGGGKTSILKIFTPHSLLHIFESRENEDHKEIYLKMKELGVISNKGPSLLGIMLSCVRNYAVLEDLDLSKGQKERLLFSLFNSRLILAMLRGVLVLKGLEYPNDLDKLRIERPHNIDLPPELPIPCNGKVLFDWATSIEKNVNEMIDSFSLAQPSAVAGHETLFSLLLMKPELIKYNDTPVSSSILVMFDDFHQLTRSQRETMFSALFTLRAPVGVWIAERLQALETKDLLNPGSNTGREYGEIISLENYWKSASRSKLFENAVKNIADRRAKMSYDIQSFSEYLQESTDTPEWYTIYEEAIEVISKRICGKIHSSEKYKNWIKNVEEIKNSDVTPRERAIKLRALEIMVARADIKGQLTLDMTLLEEFFFDKKDISRVISTAEYFVSKEFKIPYCYGISQISNLSSENINQFLSFSEGLFEEIISARLLRKNNTKISVKRQETILKKVAEKKWEEIPLQINEGRKVQKFLEVIGKLSTWETNRPNAPYSPGVTGIAITMEERDVLINSIIKNENPKYQNIAYIISACISNNLLKVSTDEKQGGKKWMKLYLNRWLCLHFGLPLSYGGWRDYKISEMAEWVEGKHVNFKKRNRVR